MENVFGGKKRFIDYYICSSFKLFIFKIRIFLVGKIIEILILDFEVIKINLI